MRVIGIDPGTAIVGFGIIDYEKNKYNCVDYGVILTDKDLNVEDRLEIVYDELTKILKKYSPEYIAVEDLFYFKNNKTVISVAQARGIILLAAKQNKIPINSYTPLQVKMGICITHINSLTSKLSSMNVTNLKNIKIDGKTNTISLADYKELLKK